MKNNEKNLQSFSMVMWGVAEEFGGKISDNGMMMRFRALLDYSLPQITAAGSWLLKNREKPFPPVPTTKEFIDAIRVLEGVVEVSLQSRAQAQIDIVLTKLKRQGRNATVDFEDPITCKLMTDRWPYRTWAAVVREDELKWWRKEFVEAYRAYDEQAKAGLIALPRGNNNGNAKRLEDLAKTTLKVVSV